MLTVQTNINLTFRAKSEVYCIGSSIEKYGFKNGKTGSMGSHKIDQMFLQELSFFSRNRKISRNLHCLHFDSIFRIYQLLTISLETAEKSHHKLVNPRCV